MSEVDMSTNTWTVVSTTAETTVDLTQNQNGNIKIAGYVFNISDFDIEVVGNDAAVSLQAIGPFPTSEAFDVTDTTFAIGGGKVSISGFSVGSFVFTRVGTTAYTINIIRKIR